MRDILVCPLSGQLERCRVVLPSDRRCVRRGWSFPQIVLGGEPLVVCPPHAELFRPHRRPRIRLTGEGWVDLSSLDRGWPSALEPGDTPPDVGTHDE